MVFRRQEDRGGIVSMLLALLAVAGASASLQGRMLGPDRDLEKAS